MVISRRRLFACFLAISATSSTAAFVPAARTSKIIPSTTTTNLHVVAPGPAELADLTTAAQDLFASTHLLVADAAAATADAAADTAKDPSWWDNYLQIFRNILVFIHGKIDQPLKNAGVEYTWGPSIALFTVCMRSLLIPLSIQQNKSAEYMKALKPYMTEIKEKFKDNENARNSATGKLMEDANQNPLAGCALSIVQLPVLLGLYRGIRLLAFEGQLKEPFLWIPSLEGPVSPPDFRGLDWLTSGWYTDPVTNNLTPPLGWEPTLAFLAFPALLVVLQTITLTILQPPQDENLSEEEKKQAETTQLVFKLLPLFLGFFALQVPAALTIYWVTTNLFTLTQSLTVRAWFAANPPEINLPDYWETLSSDKSVDEMTPEEKRAAVQAGLSVGPSMEDLKIESKFHTYIERTPLKDDSPAWDRVLAAAETEDPLKIPKEMESWVGQTAAPEAAAASPLQNNTAPVAA